MYTYYAYKFVQIIKVFQDGLLSCANSFEIFSIIIYKPAFY